MLIVSNAGKGVVYWLRMGSADIGRRLRQTAWLGDTPAGTEAAVPLPSALVAAVAVLSVCSVLIVLYANWRYLARGGGRRLGPGAVWLRSYALVMLAAVAAHLSATSGTNGRAASPMSSTASSISL